MTGRVSAPHASATVRAAAAGVSAHLVWQVSARIASFGIRAIVVRALGPAQFAFVEIRLTLLVSLALLPAIGAFRKVCLRAPDDRTAAALSYLCALITFTVSAFLGGQALYRDTTNAVSWAIVTSSLLVRAFAEPPLVFARRRERYSQSSRARAVSTVLSGVGQTLVLAAVSDPRWAKPASASGHLFYSTCLCVTMFFAAGPDRVPFLSAKEFFMYLRRDDLAMTAVALGQGMLKFFLENGEGIVLDVTCSAPVKGAYKLAGNFGSIMARFFSEALEEQSFNVFHRLAPAFRNRKPEHASTADGAEDEQDMRMTCLSTLNMALKAAISVSILIALVGPAYSYAILRLLYGEQWADRTTAPSLLNQYFVYLVFMAGNGVSEAFVSAAASTSELKAQTKFTTVLSAAYMGALFLAAKKYEATGIIVVNCINMALRTCYSAWFFQNFTGRSIGSLRSALPHPGVIATLLVAQRISRISERYFMGSGLELFPVTAKVDLLARIMLHSLSGLLALVLFSGSLLVFEKGFVLQLRSLRAVRPHQD